MDDTKLALIQASLCIAVPLETEQLKRLPLEQVLEQGKDLAQIIAEKGDVILYRSKKQEDTAKAFAALARAVATLSFAPGGVSCFGLKLESHHPDSKKPEQEQR